MNNKNYKKKEDEILTAKIFFKLLDIDEPSDKQVDLLRKVLTIAKVHLRFDKIRQDLKEGMT